MAELHLVEIDPPEPWERQPSESASDYHSFVVYRNLGPKRTFAAVARNLGVTPSRISFLASENEWKTRAEAWDFYMDRIFQAELAERQRLLAKEQFDIASQALNALNAPVQALLTKMEVDPEGTMAEFGAKDLAKLMRMAQDSIRLIPQIMSSQRLALGQPTDITEKTETHNINYNDSQRIGEVLDVLQDVGVLDAFTGARTSGPIIDAEVVEMDDDPADAETDGVHDRSP